MIDRILGGLALLGLLAYAGGSVIAVLQLSPDLFMRMGAAGVAVSLFYFSRKLKDQDSLGEYLLLKIAHEMNAGADSLETTIAKYRKAQMQETRHWQWNLILVVAATLQWGFGDLVIAAVQRGLT